jgi:uncharacterized protein (TIGR04255 family)
MSIENLYPFAGPHAVQNAIFIVEWAEPLKAEVIQSFSKLAAKYKNLGLPHVQHQQNFEFKIDTNPGVAGPRASTQPATPSAVVFARSGIPDQVVRSVTLSRSHCMIAVPDYTRWDIVFEEVFKYISIALEELKGLRPISTIALQYNDVFSWKDDPSSLNLRDVFAPNAYIPESVLQQNGLWHVHQGILADDHLPVVHRKLENVNVDMLNTAGELTIQIIGAHRAILGTPLWQAHLKNKAVLTEIFESLHIANKRMLMRLLTPAVCAKINLSSL